MMMFATDTLLPSYPQVKNPSSSMPSARRSLPERSPHRPHRKGMPPSRVPYVQQANTTQRHKHRPWHYRHPLWFGILLCVVLLGIGAACWWGITRWVSQDTLQMNPVAFYQETFMPEGRFTPDQKLQLHTVLTLLQSVVADPSKLTSEVTRTLFHVGVQDTLLHPTAWHHLLGCAAQVLGEEAPLRLGTKKVLFYQTSANNQDILLETFLEGSRGEMPVHVVLRSEVVGYQVLGFFLRDNHPELTSCLQHQPPTHP